MKFSKYPFVNLLFIVSLIGVISSIAYLTHSSTQVNKIQGPSVMAYSSKYGVVFNINRTLYYAKHDGTLITSNSFEKMGLSNIGDIAFAKNKLYISEGSKKSIISCELSLNSCKELTILDNLSGTEAIDIAVTPDEKHFYTTASNKHKIDYYTIDGKHLYRLHVDEALKYPNGIVALGDGNLVIADTNNHRIVGINHKSKDAKIIWTKAVKSEFYKEGYKWPVNVGVSSDNNIWVANLDGFFESGDVVIYEKIAQDFNTTLLKAKLLLDIENKIYNDFRPSKILSSDSSMYICDSNNFRIMEVNLNGYSYKYFGDYYIEEQLSKFRAEKHYYKSQEFISQIMIGLFIFTLIAAAIIEYIKTEDKSTLFTKVDNTHKKLNIEDAEIIDKDSNGIIWLNINQKIVKKFKLLSLSLIVLLILIISLMIFSVGFDTKLVMPLGLLSIIIVPIAILAFFMLSKQRIGVNGSQMYIRNAFGQEASDDVKNIVFTGRRILIKGIAVAITDGHGNKMFNEAQLQKYVLSLFTEINDIGEYQVFIRNLLNFDKKTWLVLLSIIIMFGFIFWIEFYK